MAGGVGGFPAEAVVLHFQFQSSESFLPEEKVSHHDIVLYCSFSLDVTTQKNIIIVSRIKV